MEKTEISRLEEEGDLAGRDQAHREGARGGREAAQVSREGHQQGLQGSPEGT